MMADIAFIVVYMALRGMGDFNVSTLERILSARRAVADDRAGGLSGGPPAYSWYHRLWEYLILNSN